MGNTTDTTTAARWEAHQGAVESVSFHPDGRSLVIARCSSSPSSSSCQASGAHARALTQATCGSDGYVKMWNREDNKIMWKKSLVPRAP